jgi:type IV secretory pathway VirB9-like protein
MPILKRLIAPCLMSALLPIALAFEEQGTVQARTIKYDERDIVTVNCSLRHTTLIVLPKDEEILDFTCGDREYWVVEGTANFAHVKPSKAGARTNINLITASGSVYSFDVREISDVQGKEADLKLFIEPKEGSTVSKNTAARFVPAGDVESYRELADTARAEAIQAKEDASRNIEAEVTRFLSEYPSRLRFNYRFQANKAPFMVTSIFDDGRFTYIRANPSEAPALYEVKDGKPSLVNFEFRSGTYIASKVIDSGYLAIGKKKMAFFRKE